MTRPPVLAKSDNCSSDCRNGQIWNPGTGPYPCPLCQGNNSTQKAGR
ncbi:hypothetical protein ACFQ08_02235 [Streptosporangium algeriense]|uniref:Uncharacterized protein n=1 Tax=Streptosporangium algeriense TaxID=1682748 RepID=A0ABW3DJL1_9ACTN